MTNALIERVDDLERRFRGLERELGEIRTMLEPPPILPEPTFSDAWLTQTSEAPPVVDRTPPVAAMPAPRARRTPPAPPLAPSPPRAPSRTAHEVLEASDLLGARGLAVVGGLVTLLGIAFFFVLAANHGWIGPVARVTLGGIASALVFGSGFVLRHRYGQLHTALAAVGTGIAGGYTTLLAAAAIYDLVPEAVALAIAAAIAAAAVVVAIAWSSETVAGLGLLGAAAVPALHALDGALSASAVAFVVLVFAASAVVALRQGWPSLLGSTALVTVAQTLWLFFTANDGDVGTIVVGAALFVVLVAAALALQHSSGSTRLDARAGSLALAAAGVALIGSLAVFVTPAHAGVALLVAAAVFVAGGAIALRLSRDLATLLGGLALTLAAVGAADLLSSRSLTLVWAAEAIALGVLGVRLGQPRFRLAALAYVPLALVHALAVEAPLGRLFDDTATGYATGVPSLVAVAIAAAVVAWRDFDRHWISSAWPVVRGSLAAIATLLVLDAGSLLVVDVSFRVGHTIVTGLWAAVALGVVVAGAQRKNEIVTTAGFAWLAVAFVKAWPAFDWTHLGHHLGAVSLLAVAVPLVLAGVALRVLDDSAEPLGLVSGVCFAVALVSFAVAIDTLVSGDRSAGAAMLAPAAFFAVLATATFRVERLRNLTTALWAHGLVALLLAEAALTQGRGIAVAYAATAAVLAVLAAHTRERRFHVAATIVLGATTLATVAFLTTPDRLVHATAHPGVSLWALFGCIAAGIVLAACDVPSRTWVASLSAVVAVYALSLGILDLAERISSASVATDFQRGHTVVTAFWALIGLGLLVPGCYGAPPR